MGTVGYMSPEQAQGKTNEIDQRSDIFSFGCILYEAVTGKKPFEDDSVVKSLHMVIYESAPAIAERNPSVPTTRSFTSASAKKMRPLTGFRRRRGAQRLPDLLKD